MTPVEKYRRLVKLLWSRTSEKAIPWKWDSGARIVTCWIGKRPLTISETANNDFEELYVFTIYNEKSEPVERFNDENLTGEVPGDGFETYFGLSQTLFETAQKQATGADVALDEILSRLENNDIEDVPF